MAAVLVVDDDHNIRDVLGELFSENHFCATVGSAEQALVLLEGRRFDVAIVDISLPGMSGLELMGHIRQRWPETPVIIITGIDYRQYTEDLSRMGAVDYLVKPFQLQDVEEKVARTILEREGWLDAVKERAERAMRAHDHSQKEERAEGTPQVEKVSENEAKAREEAEKEAAWMVERRGAVRHRHQRAARLLYVLAVSEAQGNVKGAPPLIGHTRDLSVTGLSLVVPALRASDREFYGKKDTLHITLSLPTQNLEIQAIPVRYQWLDEYSGIKSYLIGAHIVNMSDGDRALFNRYLEMLQ
jgi:DNA-binding response OmpR family regulator